MITWVRHFSSIVAASAVLVSTSWPAHAQTTVKVGQLYDATGPIASTSTPYAKGGQAAVRWINASGGINGKKIELLAEDYGYQIPRALALYRKFKSAGVVAIQGFGSGDTEALADTVAADKIVWFSASYSAQLTDAKKTPYNYMVGCDYSCQVRAALLHMSETAKQTSKPGRVAVVYMDSAFGKTVLPAVDSYAKELGMEVVAREIVNAGALDAVPQLTRIKAANPDFLLMQEIVSSVSTILKDAGKVGLETRNYGTVWTWDPNLPKLAGKAAEGMVSVQLASLSSEGLPVAQAMRTHTDDVALLEDGNFIRGWASMVVMAEAMRMADRAGRLDGEGVKAALDSGTVFESGGAAPGMKYSPVDHRSTDTVVLYRIENGKPVRLKQVSLERRASWLGN